MSRVIAVGRLIRIRVRVRDRVRVPRVIAVGRLQQCALVVEEEVVYAWYVHGICMVCAWYMHGVCTVSACMPICLQQCALMEEEDGRREHR